MPLKCKNTQSTPLSCSAAVLNLCYFNSATRSRINLPLVTRCHVMRIRWPEFTKLEFWNAAKCENSCTASVSGLMLMNGSQWSEKCSLTAPVVAIAMKIVSYVMAALVRYPLQK